MTTIRSVSASISPTAHYTGQVWLRHGLSYPALQTLPGQIFYRALQPAMAVSQRLGGPTLEHFLLARHQLIDLLLTRAIEAGEVSQVIEIAAGLSPRGLRFAQRYGERISYIEADLPAMAATKRRLIAPLISNGKNHRVVALDALATSGPLSLSAACKTLDPKQGTAIITEGLLNYFDRPNVEYMWASFGCALAGFRQGLYLSDLHLAASNQGAIANAFVLMLSAFVRGRVHLHFANASEAEAALAKHGLHGSLLRPQDYADQLPACGSVGARLVRVIAARTALGH